MILNSNSDSEALKIGDNNILECKGENERLSAHTGLFEEAATNKKDQILIQNPRSHHLFSSWKHHHPSCTGETGNESCENLC